MFNHARMLIEGGDIGAARGWIDRATEAGNPRFRAQVDEWIAVRPELGL